VDAEALKRALMVSAYGGFLVGQQAARRMVEKGSGAIFFTGATASVKGYAHSASFGMGKFALRALAQSMARELGPKNIHVAHFVIDGSIDVPGRDRSADYEDGLLEPDAIAATYMAVLQQHRSAWTHELDLRPWGERF
jgi:NAD(P)-dependent dehydrogenase (short-subunit alcohol dehydrogenase family)